jgi:hypothetical protein
VLNGIAHDAGSSVQRRSAGYKHLVEAYIKSSIQRAEEARGKIC